MSGEVIFYSSKWYHGSDYFVFGFYYSWGSWSGNTISLTLKASYTKDSHLTGPMNVTLRGGNHTAINNKQMIGYVCVGAGSGSGLRGAIVSGTVTINASEVQNNTVWVSAECTDSYMGGTKYYSIPLDVPSRPAGNPTGSTSVTNITQTTASRRAVVGTWGTNATAGTWTWTYGIGQYNLNSGGSTNATLSNLQPDTTYSYKFYIRNGQGKTATYTGSFRTLAYTKPSSSISLNSVTTNSIVCNYSTSGSNISQFRVYVDGSLWTTINTTAASGTFTVSGLGAKTTHSIYIQAYTPTGGLWGNNSNSISATTYPNPVYVTNAVITELLPFNCRVQASTSNATDTNGYGFTLLDSNKGVLRSEIVQNSGTYNFTGLTPETTYYARVRVRTATSNAWSSYVDVMFVTPADQASIFIKVNNVWRRGKAWYKISGSWVKAKNIFVNNNGWHKNNNN